MEEYWDLYDEKRKKINKVVKRGEKLDDNEYHLVINAWIKNSNNEFLITQRSANKKFAFMWECTGGSALKGETSLQAAVREVKEELGIDVNEKSGILIGSTLRHFSGCPDILDVWLFQQDFPIENVVVQEEEVCNVMWADLNTIKRLYEENKFEANAFFEDALDYIREDIYYIGFNANNAICNDTFFKGSITLYPTKEKGNIYYSDKLLEDTSSLKFIEKYKKYIYLNAKKIQMENKNSKFICFNEKIRKICSDMIDINIVKSNNSEIVDFLNDKFKTREFVKDIVPIMDYYYVKESMNYQQLKDKIGSEKFVIQYPTGAGGDGTILVEKEEDFRFLNKDIKTYCVSKYVKHLPLNITLIIGDKDIIILPISIQLIKLDDNKFKYVGGDFCIKSKLEDGIVKQIEKYSLHIAEKIKEKGYRGILGIDFILCDKNKILFMEINPRFQASSFLISLFLQKEFGTTVAELHYSAMTGKKLKKVYLENINQSFVNCNNKNHFDNISDFELITNGYFADNNSSNYRKICNRSIIFEDDFEKINLD